MNLKIVIAADHAGFRMKEELKPWLEEQKFPTTDQGTHSESSMDYPDIAHPLALAVEKGEFDLGILVCGSANGVAMAANKHQGIRAAVCWTPETAALSRQHNNANVLCLPARFIDTATAISILDIFLRSEFEGGRHGRRADKISC